MSGVTTVVTFIIVTVLADFSNCQTDYCAISSCPSRSHTLCKYTSVSQRCLQGGDLGSGLNQKERAEVVNRHNALRQRVASGAETRGSPGPQYGAKSMPNLVWDNELATIAQRWADQCTSGHDSCRKVERYSVGQNAGRISTSGDITTLQYTTIVDNWYNEVAMFNREGITSYSFDSNTGHYTALVWAKTTKIGCGARKYLDGRMKNLHLICNYGPSGNVQTQSVYEKR